MLVVDDNVDAAETLAHLLQVWGCDVQVVHDGPAAIQAAISAVPNVVLLDIGLPGMDGYEVAGRLREQECLRNTALVAVTGYGREEDRRLAREAKLDYHLTKPVAPRGVATTDSRGVGRPAAAVLTAETRASCPSSFGQSAAVNVPESNSQLEALEIELLAEAVFRRYGYDFREYATACLKRRLRTLIRSEGLTTVSGLQEKVLHDPACLERFLPALLVNVTSLFRDPDFFLAFRNKVAPLLRTYPFVRIWHAGCSTGEEVYAMAILLEEEGLYDRSRIYGTDMHAAVLQRAREGVFPLSAVQGYAGNYAAAGGKRSLSDYYTVCSGNAVFHSPLKRNMIFSQHNLTDGSILQ